VKRRKRRSPPTPTSPEPPGSLVTVEERVNWIVGLMADDVWDTRKHQRELSAAWGVERNTVRRLAAEAHRLLAFDPAKRQQLREQIARRMEALYELARTTKSRVTGLPDTRSAIEALEKYGVYAGINVDEPMQPTKQQRPIIKIMTLPPKGTP
jgi:hypothetical protein